jgi:DNA polymerase I
VLCHPGGRTRGAHEDFKPFAWLGAKTPHAGVSFERLKGEGTFNWLAQAESLAAFGVFFKAVREGAAVDVLKPYESQWLLQQRARQFADLKFSDLRRCQLDIETGAVEPGAFSDAKNPGDRVLAIGLQCGPRRELLTLGEETDAGEKRLLLEFNDLLREMDPDVVEGHNIFKFDLDYLRTRSKRHKVPCAWGRFGLTAEFRNSRMKVAERWIDFPRCDMPGRAIIDTYLLVQLYDITAREMTAYGLKDAARYFGITPESGEGRTYIDGAQIQHAFRATRAAFLAYLADDLRETRGLADVLLPTYFEQARAFPILLQEAALRGTAGKVDLLFLEEYYHARVELSGPGGYRAIRRRVHPQFSGWCLPTCPAFRRGLTLPEPAAADGPQPPERHSRGVHPDVAPPAGIPAEIQAAGQVGADCGRTRRSTGAAGDLQDSHQFLLWLPRFFRRALRRRRTGGGGHATGSRALAGPHRGVPETRLHHS